VFFLGEASDVTTFLLGPPRAGLLVLAAAVVALSVLASSGSASAQGRMKEPDFLLFGGGYYDLFDEDNTGEIRVEYIFSEENKLWFFTPFIGFTATGEGGTYGYAGVGIDIFFGRRFVMTPNFAAGIYGNGDGKDLGYPVEFRSGVNFAYRFDDRSRLGLAFHHISNAGLDDRNPGVESLVLTYSIPFDVLFGN
jgi:lipid A 3-O-deacylase